MEEAIYSLEIARYPSPVNADLAPTVFPKKKITFPPINWRQADRLNFHVLLNVVIQFPAGIEADLDVFQCKRHYGSNFRHQFGIFHDPPVVDLELFEKVI